MQETRVDSRLMYQGKIIDLKVDTVTLPNGKQTTREVVVHPGAVAIVAVTQDREFLLLRQFRYPVLEVLWEIPAGKLERNEDPLACAKRELAEETGYGAKDWEHLTTFFTTPGFSDEVMHVYKAAALYYDPKQADDDEFIEVHRIPLEEAQDMISTGKIKDAKTIAGILLALHK